MNFNNSINYLVSQNLIPRHQKKNQQKNNNPTMMEAVNSRLCFLSRHSPVGTFLFKLLRKRHSPYFTSLSYTLFDSVISLSSDYFYCITQTGQSLWFLRSQLYSVNVYLECKMLRETAVLLTKLIIPWRKKTPKILSSPQNLYKKSYLWTPKAILKSSALSTL